MTTKVEELITSARRHLEESKQQIFLQSQDEQDCINRMVLDVNKSADDFVEADEFFKSVPTEAVQKLLEELDPVLRNEYVNQSFIFIFLDSVLFFWKNVKCYRFQSVSQDTCLLYLHHVQGYNEPFAYISNKHPQTCF